MRRSYQYRIHPNAAQAEKLVRMQDRCRVLHNVGLEERGEATGGLADRAGTVENLDDL